MDVVRMVAQKALRRLEEEQGATGLELLHLLLDNIDQAAFLVDHDTRRIAWANSAVREVFGYAPAELADQPTRLLHPDDHAFGEFGARSRPLVEGGEAFRHRSWMRRRTGAVFPSEHLVTAVRQTVGRRLVVSVVTDLSAHLEGGLRRAFERLSGREREILQLTMDGLSHREIAEQLKLSLRTVEVHRASVLRKLGAKSTHKLMADLLAASLKQRVRL